MNLISQSGIVNTCCWQEIKITPIIKSFINVDDPLVIHIIKSGWELPQMYSVVIENGELGYPSLQFLNEEQIKEKFNITIN